MEVLIVGTYTERNAPAVTQKQLLGDGIYVYSYISGNGWVNHLLSIKAESNPSYINFIKQRMFVVSEIDHGSILIEYEFVIDQKFELRQKARLALAGTAACHLEIDEAHGLAFISNYMSGNVHVINISIPGNPTYIQTVSFVGSSVNKLRQECAHVHSCLVEGNRVYIADLGMDRIHKCEICDGRLKSIGDIVTRGGAGPRHMVFRKTDNKDFLYVVNELDCTLSVFADEKEIQIVQLVSPEDIYQKKALGADIHISDDGYLYISVRGSNVLCSFDILEQGTVKWHQNTPSYGDGPRSFCLDESQEHLIVANQESGNLVVYERHRGSLLKIGIFNTPLPVKVITKEVEVYE